jgi:hypothetical protein
MATDGFRPLPSHYDRCFGCGRDHPTGLHLEMWGLDDELRVRGSFTVTEYHQGAPGLAHGGVISARLELHARVDRREGRKIWASMHGRVDDDVAVEAEALYVMVGLEHFVPHAERMGERMAERPYNP